jgi:hypothetical protein
MEEERQSFITSREAFVRRLCFWQVFLLLPWLAWMLLTAPLTRHPGGLGALYFWVLVPGIFYLGAIAVIARCLQKKEGILCPACANRLGSQLPFEHVILTGQCPRCQQDLFAAPARAVAGKNAAKF